MLTSHEVFIQIYYPESPLEGMVGTSKYPCFYLGILDTYNNKFVGISLSMPERLILEMFYNKFVNIYIPEIGLYRNVKFSSNSFKSLISGSYILPANDVE